MRHYVRAKELKAAGMDCTDVLAVEDENRRLGSRRAAGQQCLWQHGGPRRTDGSRTDREMARIRLGFRVMMLHRLGRRDEAR